jgi:hypothetical protein
LFGDALSA